MPPMQERPSGSATRVLIASDATYAVARLETLAGYSDRVSLVGFSRETSELEEDIRLLRPDVLLLHQDFGHLDIVSLVSALARNVPGLGVVVVLDAADEVLTGRIEREGAGTIVATAAEGPDLIAAIDGAVTAMAPPGLADLTAPPVLPWMPEPAGPSAGTTQVAAETPAPAFGPTTGEAVTAIPQPPSSAPAVPVFQLDDTLGSDSPVQVSETPPPERVPEQPVRTRPAKRNSKERAELFVVFSGKGGVGKSVIATNLAVAMAAKGNRVAIVDLDLQFGDVAVMLHAENHPTAIDALAQQGEQVESEFIEEVMATGPEGVRALLAPTSPEFADLVNTANLRAILRELATTYDQIIVDTPAHLEERNLEAIELADQILVVTNFNITAIKDTKVTLKLLQSLGIPKERICLVLNQTRARAGFTPAEIDYILHFPVVASLPFEPKIDECIDAGKTIITAEPKSEFSKQLRLLVDHLSPAAKEAPLGAHGERPREGTSRRRFSLGRS